MAMLAEQAGVSKITVSRALSGSELVRPELRERIAAIAREAGYRMNTAARSLRTRRSHIIVMVIVTAEEARLHGGCWETLRAYDAAVEEKRREQGRMRMAARIDALALAASMPSDDFEPTDAAVFAGLEIA